MKRRQSRCLTAASAFAMLFGLTDTSTVAGEGCMTSIPAGNVNGHWTTDGSPYCIEGNIEIGDLTIDAGVTVLVEGDFYIAVNGVLRAKGTLCEPIVFTSSDPGARWKGMWMGDIPDGSQLIHCTISRANTSGLRLINARPLIQGCTFIDNIRTTGDGGGLAINLPSGDLTLQNCVIENNTSPDDGGGIYAIMGSGTLTLTDCTVRNNKANPAFNNVDGYGGGVWLNGNGHFVRCDILGNSCVGDRDGGCCNVQSYSAGGGLFLTEGTTTIVACRIKSNSARASMDGSSPNDANVYGGGLWATSTAIVDIRGTIIACNDSQADAPSEERIYGAGLGSAGAVQMINCTVARNTGNSDVEGIRREGGSMSICNSIVYFNDGPEITGSGVAVTYSNVQGGYGGEGNIPGGLNPVFEDDACPGNFMIQSVSPCVDAGKPEAEYFDACIPPAFGNILPDMGAHGGPTSCQWIDAQCTGDLNSDGNVGVVDLLLLLAAWGDDPCLDDPDGDGDVDVLDLLVLLGAWGECP